MVTEIRKCLAELGFKGNEIKVYVALTKLGEASASRVAAKAGLPRTTVISILNKLAEDNYLTMHRYRGVTRYWVESPRTIISGLETKMQVAEGLNVLLTDLYRSDTHFPYARVLDTKSAIRNFIDRTLSGLKKGSVICTIDTPNAGNYSKIFSEGIEQAMLRKKVARRVKTRTLVPHGSFTSIPGRRLTDQDIEIREMPEDIAFRASFWIVDDMLVHFSGSPPFVVALRHEPIVGGMKSVYDYLWGVSRPAGKSPK